ncbi:MAG: MFS transporter [Armatimonadetes bacterium]|nr:MFS transporter [Armatimonadota bacterium]
MIQWRGVLSVAAALAIQFCNGGLYAWSSFVPALIDQYGLSATQCALIFSTTMAFFVSAMVLGGAMQERHGPRRLVFLSGLLFAAGYLIAARSGGYLPALLIGIGCLGGTAIGLGYVCALSTGPRWFPDRPGLVTGIVVASFGASGMVVSQVATAMLARGIDVLSILGQIGGVYAAVVLLAGAALSVPNRDSGQRMAKCVVRPWQILSEPKVLSLSVGMFCGTFGGLLAISNLKPLVMSCGGSPSVAAWAVGAFAVGNALGRVLWGWLADRIGKAAVPASLASLAAALFLLQHPVAQYSLTWTCAGLGTCFGAAFVVYATEVARSYGRAALGLVYPWVFLSYGLAGVTGPALGGLLADALGQFRTATLIGAAVAAAGIPATYLLSRLSPHGHAESCGDRLARLIG